MKKCTEKCRDNLQRYNQFKQLPVDHQTEEAFPYERYLHIEDLSDRYEAIVGPLVEDRQFVKETYKYSVVPSLRPQDKKKQEDSPPEEINEANAALYKKNRLDWLRFLKGCLSTLIHFNTSPTFPPLSLSCLPPSLFTPLLPF